MAERILNTDAGLQLNLEQYHYELTWKAKGGLTLHNTCNYLTEILFNTTYRPQFIVFHVGTNDLMDHANEAIYFSIRQVLEVCGRMLPDTTIIWSAIFPRPHFRGAINQRAIKKKRSQINRSARNLVWRAGGKFLDFPYLNGNDSSFFRHDDIHLSSMGYDYFADVIKHALEFFHFFPLVIKYPPFNG